MDPGYVFRGDRGLLFLSLKKESEGSCPIVYNIIFSHGKLPSAQRVHIGALSPNTALSPSLITVRLNISFNKHRRSLLQHARPPSS